MKSVHKQIVRKFDRKFVGIFGELTTTETWIDDKALDAFLLDARVSANITFVDEALSGQE